MEDKVGCLKAVCDCYTLENTQIKDLPDGTNLEGLKVKTPCGKVGLWQSYRNGVVKLSDGFTKKTYPIYISNLDDVLKWEIVDEIINLK